MISGRVIAVKELQYDVMVSWQIVTCSDAMVMSTLVLGLLQLTTLQQQIDGFLRHSPARLVSSSPCTVVMHHLSPFSVVALDAGSSLSRWS